jgi:hypothetical protein
MLAQQSAELGHHASDCRRTAPRITALWNEDDTELCLAASVVIVGDA